MRHLPDQLAISLNADDGRTLQEQVRAGISDAIISGRLKPGARIPSSRALAEHLAVSRNTITGALEQLVAEGSLESRYGAGHYVPGDLAPMGGQNSDDGCDSGDAESIRWSAQGEQLGLMSARRLLPSTEVRPFRPAAPALDRFPFRTWRRIANRLSRSMDAKARRDLLWEGDPAGLPELRAAIADYVAAARGVRCEADQVVIVAGSQQALHLASLLLLDPGDEVWVEDPGYLSARAAASAAGARIVAIPVDHEGAVVEYGEATAPRARMAHVTPSVQFPLGTTMSLGRRLRLLDWARRERAWIVEDDYDSEYRYEGRPITALQGLDDGGRVLYVGTFSKVIFPALRLGYMVLPRPLVRTFVTAKAVVDRHCPSFDQAVLAKFIGDGHLAAHIRRMRRLYHARQQALIAACRAHAGDMLEVEKAGAGLHLLARLRDGTDAERVGEAAARQGVDAVPLGRFTLRHDRPPALALGFAAFDHDEIDQGARKLARAIADLG